MKIFITGATGFVGSILVPELISKGHELILLLRKGEEKKFNDLEVKTFIGDPMLSGDHWSELQKSDAAINLAGYPVFNKWTNDIKNMIRESRLKTTENLVNSIPKEKNFCLINASGIGIYGNCADEMLDENQAFGSDFLARVAIEWENIAKSAHKGLTRVALARFGIILGSTGGALPDMVSNIKKFGAGNISSGQQWIPWIHVEDVVKGIIHIIDNENCSGAYNFTSPNPVRQKDFAAMLGGILHRPAIVPVPLPLLKLVLGEFAEIATSSQRARPTRLLESGFTFRFDNLTDALANILSDMNG